MAQARLGRFFRELTDKALRRGVFASVPDLITAVEAYLQATNDDPKPFVWTATAQSILDKGPPGPRHSRHNRRLNRDTPVEPLSDPMEAERRDSVYRRRRVRRGDPTLRGEVIVEGEYEVGPAGSGTVGHRGRVGDP